MPIASRFAILKKHEPHLGPSRFVILKEMRTALARRAR